MDYYFISEQIARILYEANVKRRDSFGTPYWRELKNSKDDLNFEIFLLFSVYADRLHLIDTFINAYTLILEKDFQIREEKNNCYTKIIWFSQ